jgi:ribonuclease D
MAVDGAARARADGQLIDEPAALAEVVAELSEADRYGLDTEFHRERSYFPHLALLQVAWAGGIALIDPLAVDVAPLAEVLAGPGLAVLHAADQDLEVLDRACGRVPSRLFDTQLAAGFIGFSSPSLTSLVERLLGQRLEKGDQLTDWTRRPLTGAQARYAASDVAHLLELHDRIAEELASTGREAWADEECALMLARARSAVVPEEAWWRIKHARQLRGPERGIAQCVCAWRERRAQSLDLPVRFILSDLALLSITHRPPRTRAELEEVRSLDVRQLGGGAASELLAAVAEGRNLSGKALRLPPSHGASAPVRPAVTLAAAWLAERAQELRIDPAILATRADLVAYLQEHPEGRLVNTWRHGLIGAPLARLAAGELALAFGADGTLVLEERSRRPVRVDGAG